jgi:hypothetical protein
VYIEYITDNYQCSRPPLHNITTTVTNLQKILTIFILIQKYKKLFSHLEASHKANFSGHFGRKLQPISDLTPQQAVLTVQQRLNDDLQENTKGI